MRTATSLPMVVLICCVAVATVGAQTETTTTVVSLRDPDTIERLAQGIVALDAEVVALQAVHPDRIAARIVTRAKARGAHDAVPVLLDQPHPVNLAILHTDSVSVHNARLIADSDVGQPPRQLCRATPRCAPWQRVAASPGSRR